MTQAVNLAALANNGSLQMPTWTTAGRPTGATGLTGYNTSLNLVEVYNGTAWVAVGDQTTLYSASILIVAGVVVVLVTAAEALVLAVSYIIHLLLYLQAQRIQSQLVLGVLGVVAVVVGREQTAATLHLQV